MCRVSLTGKFKPSRYKGATVVSWCFTTLVVTSCWTCRKWRLGHSPGTSSNLGCHALVQLQHFLCFWWTWTKVHFPFLGNLEKVTTARRNRWFPYIGAPLFFYDFVISSSVDLGRKSYKKKLLEFADSTGIPLEPLAVYALLWSLACLGWIFCN